MEKQIEKFEKKKRNFDPTDKTQLLAFLLKA